MGILFSGLLGLIPFLLLFLGLTVTKLKSYLVTFLVLTFSLILAYFVWNTGLNTLFGAVFEGILVALIPIIWVIFAAVFTYLISVETGAMDIIKRFLMDITPDRNVQVVIIAFCLGGFLESIAGFGTAVALPTAMLMSMGIRPLKAAVLALVANSVPVAFGALGIPVIVLSQITSLDLSVLTKYTVLQLLPFSILVPVALVLIHNEGTKGIKNAIPETLLIGILFSIGQTLTAFFIGPELVAVIGSIFSLIAYILFKYFRQNNNIKRDYGKITWASCNYIILLILVFITRLVLKDFLAKPAFNIILYIGEHKVTMDYISTPGTLLLISAAAGGFIQGISIRKIGMLMISTINKIKWSALTILNIVALAKVMGYSGIIASVAGMTALVTRGFYPFFAPVIGAAGTFVTGSDTSSNILLGELQKLTAQKIGANMEWISASNTSGAAAGKMISPQSISIAASTVGIESDENRIMRTTILFCLGYVMILGLYVFLVNKYITLWRF